MSFLLFHFYEYIQTDVLPEDLLVSREVIVFASDGQSLAFVKRLQPILSITDAVNKVEMNVNLQTQ